MIDITEVYKLALILRHRCGSRRFRDHIHACRRALDLATAQHHLVAAFEIALRHHDVMPGEWRAWAQGASATGPGEHASGAH
jgi:hypothetical protein